MIEKIIEWSAHNRLIVIASFVLLISAGIYAMARLPVDAIPDLSENQVIVFTEWMGRSPEIIEDQVTFPIATALQGLAEVKAVRASSMFGMSFVFAIFEDNTDLYFARTRVLEKLNTMRSSLPPGVTPSLGPDGTGVGHVFWYTVEGPYDLGTLRALQDWDIRYKLSSVEGVAEIASIGGFVKQYQVDVDPWKLKAYALTLEDIIRAIQRNNNETGGKVIESSSAEYFIRGQGYVRSVRDIENIILKSSPSGTPVFLSHVAVVQTGPDIRRGALEKNGQGEVVGGIVVMRHGENARQVIERVKIKISEIQPGLPEGVKIIPSYDRSILIDEAVGTLEKALLEAAIIVSIVVIIFLLHFRSVVRILIEIPVTVVIAFLLMYLFNITSNIMSLGGIILGIGVIVDASIVLVENAHRHLARAIEEKGALQPADYKAISIMAAKQVGRAIFFSELIILVSFLPVFLLTGPEGKLFHPLAFTKTFMMVGSAATAITFIPVLMTFFMRGRFVNEERNRISHFMHILYRPVLRWCLKYRKTTLALNVLALIITVPMIADTNSEFMPSLDEGSILYMPVTLPAVSIAEVNRIMRIQDQIIQSVPEVDHVLGKAGKAETSTDNAPLSMIETIILLKPRSEWREGITKRDILNELDQKLQIPGVTNGWTQPIINRIQMLATGVRTDIGLKIFGNNLDTLEYYAVRAEQILKQVPGASDVVAERLQKGLYLDINPKPERLARYGLSVQDLQMVIETAIGGQNLGTVYENRMRFPVRMRYARDYRDNQASLNQLLVPVPSAGGVSDNVSSGTISGMTGQRMAMNKPGNQREESGFTFSLLGGRSYGIQYVPLSELADIRVTEGPPMISSENGMLRSLVYMNARGQDLSAVVQESKSVIQQQLKLPEGYSYSWTGQYENKIHADRTIRLILPLVLMSIFVLLFMTLKDVKETVVVMLSVPFALIGGIYMIYFLDYNFSVAVWVGFIALYGIAVETGVVMVVYLHEALDKRILGHQSGRLESLTKQDIYDSALEGALLRLRPKLMTVFTSMMGLIPVMWASGAGSDVMKPLTAPMIGGLLTSAIHVLIVTPVLFVIMKEHSLRKNKLTLSRLADWMK